MSAALKSASTPATIIAFPSSIDQEERLSKSRAQALGVPVEGRRRSVNEGIPLGCYGEPEELNRVAAFLLSPASSDITGVSLQVDGGLVQAIPNGQQRRVSSGI